MKPDEIEKYRATASVNDRLHPEFGRVDDLIDPNPVAPPIYVVLSVERRGVVVALLTDLSHRILIEWDQLKRFVVIHKEP